MSLILPIILGTGLAQGQIMLSPAAKVPVGASKIVDRSFPSFAIQGSSFPAYAGTAARPNVFSRHLIEGIENRTGAPLVIRVGGTNLDHSNYNPAQIEPVTPTQIADGIGQEFVFGPHFYDGFQNWPGTRFVYDVPFATKNKTLSLYQAKAALHAIGKENLEALELGNEPDLYVHQGNRPEGWNVSNYVSEFHSYSDWLAGQLGISNVKLFGVLTVAKSRSTWSAKAALEAGIGNGGRAKYISLHNYERTDGGANLQSTMMSHGFVKKGVNSYASNIQYIQANYPGIEIVFGESGRYTSSGSSIDNGQGVFGAALWTSDYLLYLMTQNVTRVNMQLGQAFGYVAWHPIALNSTRPSVRSPYLGHLLAAEFIGGSKSFRVAEIPVSYDTLAVYAGYENGLLVRLVIINFDLWSSGSDKRPTRDFSMVVPPSTTAGVVKTLTSLDGGSDSQHFYWSGLAFSYSNKGIGTLEPTIPQPKELPARGGKLSVRVGSSEAVLIQLR